jgi:hypothetical protein
VHPFVARETSGPAASLVSRRSELLAASRLPNAWGNSARSPKITTAETMANRSGILGSTEGHETERANNNNQRNDNNDERVDLRFLRSHFWKI